MPTKYRDLFYYYLAGEGANASHFILLNGYDSARSCISTREITHMNESGIIQFLPKRLCGLYTLFLSEEILEGIWTKSNKSFRELGYTAQPFYSFDCKYDNLLYIVEKTGEPKINYYSDLISDFICNLYLDNNKFVNFIRDYNNLIEQIRKYNKLPKYAFQLNLIPVFSVFEKAFEASNWDTQRQNKFYKFRDNYLSFRSGLISDILFDANKGISYSSSQISEMVDKVMAYDDDLVKFIKDGI